MARGNGGQYIFVVREVNQVVVFTGGNFNTDSDTPFTLLTQVIIPAIQE
jgi:hypothetical protein